MTQYKNKTTGEVVTKANGMNAEYYDLFKICVENNSEWKENTYQILSLSTNEGTLLTLRANGKFVEKSWSKGVFDAEILLTNDIDVWVKEYPKEFSHSADENLKYKIHSIKRLSDGVIFTVGDRINGVTYNNRPLLEFVRYDEDSDICLRQHDETNTVVGGTTSLEDASIYIEEALYITEDGKRLYKGDKFWHVDPQFEIGKGVCCTDKFTKLKGYKEFSTKELAEKYVLDNKPCLSLNDLLTQFNSSDYKFLQLKKIVEGKLAQ